MAGTWWSKEFCDSATNTFWIQEMPAILSLAFFVSGNPAAQSTNLSNKAQNYRN